VNARFAAIWRRWQYESDRSGPLGLTVSGGPDSLALLLHALRCQPNRGFAALITARQTSAGSCAG
jgi:tRNA(Ile)-lysidine synthase TilS/MesJ